VLRRVVIEVVGAQDGRPGPVVGVTHLPELSEHQQMLDALEVLEV
jgi:hypothetical protein